MTPQLHAWVWPHAQACPRQGVVAGSVGTSEGSAYAKMSETMPITTISSTLCLMVNRNSQLSSPAVAPGA